MHSDYGAHVFHVVGDFTLLNPLVNDNVVSAELMLNERGGNIGANWSFCTTAHNQIGGPSVIRNTGFFELSASISSSYYGKCITHWRLAHSWERSGWLQSNEFNPGRSNVRRPAPWRLSSAGGAYERHRRCFAPGSTPLPRHQAPGLSNRS
jgi:hypothetical protein